MKNCLFYSEVLIRLFKVLSKDLEIVLQIVRDFLFPVGLDAANHAHHHLDNHLRIEGVLMIYLHSHVLNGVLCPELVLSLCDEHQGKRDLVHNHIYVVLDHLPCDLKFQPNVYGLKR